MNDLDRLRAVLAATGPVLLDFDGPVTPILATGLNRQAADRMRAVLAATGTPVPEPVRTTPDPMEVLRFAGNQADEATIDEVEATLRRCEVDAAQVSDATPGAADFLSACREAHRPVVVVSNNADEAIETYLERHGLRQYVHRVIGRAYAQPDLMKPHPAVVLSALTTLQASPDQCVLVGDSTTDIDVAKATGVRSIGYVKAPNRRAGLDHAGADATVDSMADLAAAIRAVTPCRVTDDP